MEKFQTSDIPKSPRIQKLVDALYANMPVMDKPPKLEGRHMAMFIAPKPSSQKK